MEAPKIWRRGHELINEKTIIVAGSMDHHLKTVQEAIWSNNSIKKKKPTSPNTVTKIQQEIVK